MEHAGKAIRLTLDEGMARVVLVQPDRGNPIDASFGSDLLAISGMLSTNPAVRSVLLTGEGRLFSVGGDITAFKDRLDDLPRLVLDWTATLHVALARLRHMNAPIVCAVHGAVAGGSVSVMGFADVVYAARGTRFTAAFPGIGFCADSGSTVSLSQRMGLARARRFILTNETLDAEAARDAGLVDHVVDADALLSTAEAAARDFAAGPTLAYGEIKRSFEHALSNTIERQLEIEAHALSGISGSADARAGISAFADRRKPVFLGR